MDRAVIVSLVVTILAVAALAMSTWLSSRFGGAVRAHEQAAVERYKGTESQTVQLEQELAAARARAAALEQEVATSRGRTAALEQEVSAARERAVALEQEASKARERSAAIEQAAREANERAARPAPVSTPPSETARTPQLDVAEIKQRLADLGRLVREANARASESSPGSAAEAPRPVQGEGAPEDAPASREAPPSPIVTSLRKYTGTKAAMFILDRTADAPEAGSTISAYLGDAGWSAQTWTWTGVAGIYGVVVLIKEGSDAATQEAASALVEALRSAGFSATKADWPADWRRHRGTLDGPQTPSPTDAPIRIVVGAKPR